MIDICALPAIKTDDVCHVVMSVVQTRIKNNSSNRAWDDISNIKLRMVIKL
jgi:hypothetical protein